MLGKMQGARGPSFRPRRHLYDGFASGFGGL